MLVMLIIVQLLLLIKIVMVVIIVVITTLPLTLTSRHQRWPEKALVRVGEHYLEEVSLRRSMRDTVISAATLIHQLARCVRGGWGL